MLTADPKLPQLFGPEESGEYVPISFYRRFQERFYVLWRELAKNDIEVRSLQANNVGGKLYLYNNFGGF
jgi:hypothetical protein